MPDEDLTFHEIGNVREPDQGTEGDSILIRRNPVGAIVDAAGSAGALALASLVTATATILTMSVAADFGDAKLYSSRGLNDLLGIRWIAGARLVIAAVALLLGVIAGVRYARSLPATRYVFVDSQREPDESLEGDEQPGWVTLLVGSSVVVSVLAILLNAAAFAVAMHAHQSPDFGVPRA